MPLARETGRMDASPSRPLPPLAASAAGDAGERRRIGLTGGIATGKSSVGRLLAERHGLPVLDADAYARAALAPGSPATLAVLARYGERVLANPPADQARANDEAAATIDRSALGTIVFADAAERRWLEQLLHPLVRARFDAELRRLHQAPVVVLMIPLLFEAGLEGLCSEIWVVTCDPDEQLRRLQQRDGLSATAAEARIRSQWPLEQKKALATVWIDNRQGFNELQQAVSDALTGVPAPPQELRPPEA